MSVQSSAYNAMSRALNNGVLVKSDKCERCGASALYPHHSDYNKPLQVVWLCSRCHQQWHRVNGPGRGADLSKLAKRVEHKGIIPQYIPSYVSELRRQVVEYGAYMGPNGMVAASVELFSVLKIGYVRAEGR